MTRPACPASLKRDTGYFTTHHRAAGLCCWISLTFNTAILQAIDRVDAAEQIIWDRRKILANWDTLSRWGAVGMSRMKCFLITAALFVPLRGIAAEIGGTWQGNYTCSQGLTGLTLTMAPSTGGSARGVFRFYQVEGNPGVPDGCFEMSGTVSGNQVRLQAGNWLYRPAGYVTVDLAGALDADGTAFMGSIFGPDCTTFTLHRISDDAMPASCRARDVPVS